ncbi:hypothetical protein COLO4_31698 [Corchorus olitorius]|uniref:Gnk2-homologous domain-containing protein n=1 Tax=Corchorus olitorius TaxID=93759 RepID=A0A1R3H3P3_9ROSI|nr:hypothetical protein COLO4_31698 [Corchorus olitorius]
MATMGSSRLPIILSCCSLLLLSFATLTLSAEDVYFECRYAEENKGNFTDKSTYQSNLNDIISQLSNLTDFNYGFHNLSAGGNPDKVFATALCAGDKTPNECRTCFNYTITKLIERCPWGKEVVAWSQFCMVRYANRDIFAQLDSDPRTCVYNPVNASNPDVFNQALSNLLTNLSNEASTGGALRKYAADNTTDDPQQMIFAAVQCTPDLNQENCSLCLNFAMSELSKCCAGSGSCAVPATIFTTISSASSTINIGDNRRVGFQMDKRLP